MHVRQNQSIIVRNKIKQQKRRALIYTRIYICVVTPKTNFAFLTQWRFICLNMPMSTMTAQAHTHTHRVVNRLDNEFVVCHFNYYVRGCTHNYNSQSQCVCVCMSAWILSSASSSLQCHTHTHMNPPRCTSMYSIERKITDDIETEID